MSQGDHSEQLLLLALFYQSTPSCLKVIGGRGGVGGGPEDFIVSPSPNWALGLGVRGLGLGLDNFSNLRNVVTINVN